MRIEILRTLNIAVLNNAVGKDLAKFTFFKNCIDFRNYGIIILMQIFNIQAASILYPCLHVISFIETQKLFSIIQ